MVLVEALRNPGSTASLDAQRWIQLLSIARAEQLIGTLAARLKFESVPPNVAEILEEALINAEYQRRCALWEADCALRALQPLGAKIILLKGTAYVAANLDAGMGRSIGDLDILVARDALPQVEAALVERGWEWVKPDPYDDAYYRDHMHELPPLIHKERDRMIDVHHTILPLTAKRRPDAGVMLSDAEPLASGLYVLNPTDMVCHSAAHLFADGELDGGLRNLWDIHCLLGQFSSAEFWVQLRSRAFLHQLSEPVERAVRLAHQLYGTAIPEDWMRWHRQDKWYVARLTARDGWGRPTRKFIRLIFYIRSHWLRMPPLILARHLWVKWRKR